MTAPNRIETAASELLDAARDFRSAVERPGSHVVAPEALAAIEEALQALSAAWYEVAADALPRADDPALVGALHDLAAGFARCARVCRGGRAVAMPIIARREQAA